MTYDATTEESIVGYMLTRPQDAERVQLVAAEADFRTPVARRLFASFDPQLDRKTMAEQAGVDGVKFAEVLASAAMPSTIDAAVRRLLDLSARHSALVAATELKEIVTDPTSSMADAQELMRACLDDLAPRGAVDPPMTAEDFLSLDDDTPDWLVPGLIERGERMIVTAEEGGGKSTLLRQIAALTAAGVHPLFASREIEPRQVLLIDLENSARQTRRRLRDLCMVGDLSNLRIVVRSSGIDLTKRGDQQWLLSLVASAQPDLLVIGPLYRMFGAAERGDTGGENQARQVTTVIDRCRHISGCAVLMEAHATKGDGLGFRDLRPVGSSVWMRWPEYGIGLRKDGDDPNRCLVLHWRGPRDERDWPIALHRGGLYPWAGYWPEGLKDHG